VCNIGDCHVFVFSRDAATGRWSFSHNAGESRWFSNRPGPVQFGRCSHCPASWPVNLRAHRPVEHTLKPGDVVIASSDGIVDCLSIDMGEALGMAQSEHAKRRMQGLLEATVAHWQEQAWPADVFCAALVHELVSAARVPLPQAGGPTSVRNPLVYSCGSMKPDDLVCVASVVLHATDEAREAHGPPWLLPALAAAAVAAPATSQ
jgi:hypothetical protein